MFCCTPYMGASHQLLGKSHRLASPRAVEASKQSHIIEPGIWLECVEQSKYCRIPRSEWNSDDPFQSFPSSRWQSSARENNMDALQHKKCRWRDIKITVLRGCFNPPTQNIFFKITMRDHTLNPKLIEHGVTHCNTTIKYVDKTHSDHSGLNMNGIRWNQHSRVNHLPAASAANTPPEIPKGTKRHRPTSLRPPGSCWMENHHAGSAHVMRHSYVALGLRQRWPRWLYKQDQTMFWSDSSQARSGKCGT